MQNLLEESTLPNQLPLAEAAKTINPAMTMMKQLATPEVTTGVATGVIVSAGSSLGKSALRKFFMRPLVLLGLGVGIGMGIGYVAHKYRKTLKTAVDDSQKEI
jgi:hypothetical protein